MYGPASDRRARETSTRNISIRPLVLVSKPIGRPLYFTVLEIRSPLPLNFEDFLIPIGLQMQAVDPVKG